PMLTVEHPVAGPPRPRVWLDVDLGKIRANFRAVQQHVAPCRVMAVLKANAYGLGVGPIAATLKEAGAYGFGVAELREALSIKALGLPVHILGGLIDEEIPAVVREGIVAPVTDPDIARSLSAETVRQGRAVDCHFKVDTGMGRLGILYADAERVIREAAALPGLRCAGLYSHFPYAYGDIDFSQNQVKLMTDLVERLLRAGIEFQWRHIANSDGINNIDSSFQPPFNLVRTGINLYGAFDLEGRQAISLQPALTLKTRLIAVRELPAGATIGYGRTYRLAQPRPPGESGRVGTISIGYADGLPLAMSNCGSVLIRGSRCPIVGRVSMDYTTVSLDKVRDARVGDEVVCLGDGITIKEWAKFKGTMSYDIICSIGHRVERRYHG
ncbi:MAG: alanine racemase, partial [Lentisphaerae bacterium]|nr:alanine racemase [Lentisphaerota bacterium]